MTKGGARRFNTRIGEAKEVLHELYRSVHRERELSSIAKLSVFKSTFILILTCSHES